MHLDPTINFAFILSIMIVVATLVSRTVEMRRDTRELQEYRLKHDARLERLDANITALVGLAHDTRELQEYRKLHSERIERLDREIADLNTIVTILSTKAELMDWGRGQGLVGTRGSEK